MLNPSRQAKLLAAVRASAVWRLVYQDSAAVIFAR
jgi:hypothetical protein